MGTTSKYGYPEKLEVTAFTMIDRDMQRIEEKADKALGFEADIIRSQKDIECLSKCRPGSCTQCEIDKLLDAKVDKEEGHSLISKDCLEQICQNKEGLTLLEQSMKKLEERNNWLEDELKKRPVFEQPQKYEIGFNENITPIKECYYSKSPFNYVVLNFSCQQGKEDGYLPTREDPLFTLPEGFRPDNTVEVPGTIQSYDDETTPVKAACTFYVRANGDVCLYIRGNKSARYAFCSCVFLVSQ